MSVKVIFECDGYACRATAPGVRPMRQSILSTGDEFYEYDTPQDVAPEGWKAFDPNTGSCYCPRCQDEIYSNPDDD